MDDRHWLREGTYLRNGSYRILKVLGQGGFGITYLAYDITLDRYVAIKEFFPEEFCMRDLSSNNVVVYSDSDAYFVGKLRTQFLKEARNIAKFDHPGIINIHAAFEENETAYYVMEYIEGCTLEDLVVKRGCLSEKQAIDYIRHIGHALQYIHSERLNHLDIKPSNIMIRANDGQPILIDFGVSKQYDKSGLQTSPSSVGISKGFSPTELYQSEGMNEFSPQTDIYSLAATLYFLLTKIVPPDANSLIENQLEFRTHISPRIINAISRAMSPSRKMRPASVNDFLYELIKPPQNPKPTVSHSLKGPVIGSLIALSVCLGVILFVNLYTQSEDNNDAHKVTKMIWEAPFGKTRYSGEVSSDGDDEMVPNGEGYFEIISGKSKGVTYDGDFKMGKMDGKGTYTLANGDVFEGTMKNNTVYEGRYTCLDNGDYFVGRFKNGKPYEGEWYNKSGIYLNSLSGGRSQKKGSVKSTGVKKDSRKQSSSTSNKRKDSRRHLSKGQNMKHESDNDELTSSEPKE